MNLKPLFFKLENLGVEGHASDVITEVLTDRKQHVIAYGSLSDFTSVKFGVPQGSVLLLCCLFYLLLI